MAEIRFYHLENSTAYEALPALLQKVADMGITGSVVVPSHMIEKLSETLWYSGNPASFIAHEIRSSIDKNNDVLPTFILLDTRGKQIESADLGATVFVVDDIKADMVKGVELVCYMFHGRDESVLQNARGLWKTFSSNADNTVAYFKQTGVGGWEKKV